MSGLWFVVTLELLPQQGARNASQALYPWSRSFPNMLYYYTLGCIMKEKNGGDGFLYCCRTALIVTMAVVPMNVLGWKEPEEYFPITPSCSPRKPSPSLLSK